MEIERTGHHLAARLMNDAIGRQAAVSGAAAQQRGAKPAEHEADSRADGVEISDRARELARALTAVQAAPDVRAEKVAALKQQIADGTYKVQPEQIARRLLGDSGHDNR